MIKIRPAATKDEEAVVKILKDQDIYYSALAFKDFFVAEDEGTVVGCAQLEERPDFFYLGSVGVSPSYAHKGIASKLLNRILKDLKKDIYIYTIIPDFFTKFGFEPASPRKDLPSKDRYECEDCHSDKCVCMVRRAK